MSAKIYKTATPTLINVFDTDVNNDYPEWEVVKDDAFIELLKLQKTSLIDVSALSEKTVLVAADVIYMRTSAGVVSKMTVEKFLEAQ